MVKLVKFRHNYHKGIFHYDVLDDYIVVLSQKDTGKIEYIRQHGTIDVTFKIEEEEYQIMGVDIIEDKEYVQKVYDHYFKDGIEGLCVLRFHK